MTDLQASKSSRAVAVNLQKQSFRGWLHTGLAKPSVRKILGRARDRFTSRMLDPVLGGEQVRQIPNEFLGCFQLGPPRYPKKFTIFKPTKDVESGGHLICPFPRGEAVFEK